MKKQTTPDTEWGEHQKHCHASMGYVCACTGKKPPRTCPFCLKDVAFCAKQLNGCMEYVPTPIPPEPVSELRRTFIDRYALPKDRHNFTVCLDGILQVQEKQTLTSRDTYWKEMEALNSEREYLRGFRDGQELERKVTKADWLRSEIEKLEGDLKDEVKWKKARYDVKSVSAALWNQALTSIITRYKEELKVLESK